MSKKLIDADLLRQAGALIQLKGKNFVTYKLYAMTVKPKKLSAWLHSKAQEVNL